MKQTILFVNEGTHTLSSMCGVYGRIQLHCWIVNTSTSNNIIIIADIRWKTKRKKNKWKDDNEKLNFRANKCLNMQWYIFDHTRAYLVNCLLVGLFFVAQTKRNCDDFSSEFYFFFFKLNSFQFNPMKIDFQVLWYSY